MYEQRNKDINKASVKSMYCIAKALVCVDFVFTYI